MYGYWERVLSPLQLGLPPPGLLSIWLSIPWFRLLVKHRKWIEPRLEVGPSQKIEKNGWRIKGRGREGEREGRREGRKLGSWIGISMNLERRKNHPILRWSFGNSQWTYHFQSATYDSGQTITEPKLLSVFRELNKVCQWIIFKDETKFLGVWGPIGNSWSDVEENFESNLKRARNI